MEAATGDGTFPFFKESLLDPVPANLYKDSCA